MEATVELSGNYASTSTVNINKMGVLLAIANSANLQSFYITF